MIIVEGPDGAGKTTLCAKLKEDKVVDFVLPSPRLNHDIGLFHSSLGLLYEYSSNMKVVVDRFFFSELIYGPLLRGKICFSVDQYCRLIDHLFGRGVNPIIFCLPKNLNFKDGESPEILAKSYDFHRRYGFMYDIFKGMENSLVTSYDWEDKNSYSALLEFLK